LLLDSELRVELRIPISKKLILTYRSFLAMFQSHVESGRYLENYIKCFIEDVKNVVSEFVLMGFCFPTLENDI